MKIEEALELVEQALERGRLSRIEELVFRQAWQGRSYTEMARASGYDAGYLKDTGYKLWRLLSNAYGEKVTKHSLRGVLSRSCKHQNARSARIASYSSDQCRANILWGDAIDVSIFYGRTAELSTLTQWAVQDHCRLIALLGMGGIGKTALSVKFAEDVQEQFEVLIWRSLRDAPLLDELLTTLIQCLSRPQDTRLPDSTSGKVSHLIELLRRSRCLIVLDNFDTLLQSGTQAGMYRKGYENYGELLQYLSDICHQSCVILTSREKPQELSALEGEQLPVRTLPLAGLDITAGQELLQVKGLSGTPSDTANLIAHYRGNPLALKTTATWIQDMYAGNVAQFLAQGTTAFNSISTLLMQHCERLSALEMQVMYWLAINRESVSPVELQKDLFPALTNLQLMEVLKSLRWRSLIEASAAGFTQQPVVMEYITEQLIKHISDEIVAERLHLFLSHALVKAQTKDYVRDSQIRLIVQPLLAHLLVQLGSPKQLEQKLNRILTKLHELPSNTPNYGGGNLLNLFRQVKTDLSGYDFSGLSIRQAYLQDVNLHTVNFAGAEFVDCAFACTFGGITSVAFSPDGQMLATSDTNGGIQFWRAADNQLLTVCRGHNSWVWTVAFSPVHPTLASCGQDHQVRLWDVNTGECIRILEGHTGIVTAIAFSPDGQWLASTSGDQTIRLWNVATGVCWRTLHGHHSCVWSVVFHPDGNTLLSAGEDNKIRVWDLRNGKCHQTLVGHQHWIKAISLSPDGQTLASASFDQTLKLWNLATGECLATLGGHHHTVTSVTFSPDGKQLASGSYDQTIKLWCIKSRQCLQTLHKHTNWVWSVMFHPAGYLLASGGEDYTARLWNIYTGQCIKTLQGHSNSIYTLALNSSQRLLASGHEDQTIKLWNIDNEACRSKAIIQPFRTLRGHRGRILSVAFSPNGQRLASASTDRTIKLWDSRTGQCLQTLHGHASWVWALAFHPNRQQLASASYDHTIRVWDVSTGHCLQTLQGHTSSVLAIAFAPNGQQLVSGGYEQTIKVWDAVAGDCLRTMHAHTNRVWAVAFSPNGQFFATGGDDHKVKLWDTVTGCRPLAQSATAIRSFEGHTNQILSIVFSSDGSQLISSSADQTIKCWNVDTGECLHTLQKHAHWVWSLAFLDSEILLSASQDETIQCWDRRTGARLKTLRASRPYENMNITGVTQLTEAQTLTLKALGAVSN